MSSVAQEGHLAMKIVAMAATERQLGSIAEKLHQNLAWDCAEGSITDRSATECGWLALRVGLGVERKLGHRHGSQSKKRYSGEMNISHVVRMSYDMIEM